MKARSDIAAVNFTGWRAEAWIRKQAARVAWHWRAWVDRNPLRAAAWIYAVMCVGGLYIIASAWAAIP